MLKKKAPEFVELLLYFTSVFKFSVFKFFQIGIWQKDEIDKITRLHSSGKNAKGSKGIRNYIKVFNNRHLTLITNT